MYTVTFQMRCTSVLKKNGTRGFGSNFFNSHLKMNETNLISKCEHWDYLGQKMKQKYWYFVSKIESYKNCTFYASHFFLLCLSY